MPIEKVTEEKIFIAAQKVFQSKGFDGARMQEIADEAGINKSMLHYYFRNKDNLFFAVFKNAVSKIMPQLFSILALDHTIAEKTHQIVQFYHDTFIKNPNLPSFIIYEVNKHPERFKEFIQKMNLKLPQKFIDQIHTEIQEGRMIKIKPEQFLMNVVSMSMMPLIAKNIVQVIFNLDEKNYAEFLNERRQFIPDLILEGVKKE